MTFSVFTSYTIYFSTFLVASFFAGLYSKERSLGKYVYFVLAISLPSVLASSRGIEVGTDYIEYVRHINEIVLKIDSRLNFSDLDSQFEFGFNLLIYLITRVSDDIPLVVYFIYLFVAFFALCACKSLIPPKYVFWGYLFYLCNFWLFGFNGLRQAIALAIVFYSLRYIKERKLSFFVITVVFAMSFHSTAIIIAPLYFIVNSRSVRREKIVFIITLVGIIGASVFLETASRIAGYEGYLQSAYVQDDPSTAILKIFQTALLLSPVFMLQSKLTKMQPFNMLYFRSLFMYLATLILSIQITQATRLSLYLEIALIIIAVETIRYSRMLGDKTSHLFVLYLLFYFIIYKFVYIYSSSGEVIPYSLF